MQTRQRGAQPRKPVFDCACVCLSVCVFQRVCVSERDREGENGGSTNRVLDASRQHSRVRTRARRQRLTDARNS